MAGKIFSSRDEISLDDALHDFVFLVHDVLEKEESPADDTEALCEQLDIGLVEVAERYQRVHEMCAALTMDVLTLTIHNGKMFHELRDTMRVLEALAAPTNGTPFDKAFQTLKREGKPRVSAVSAKPGDSDELEMDVQLSFTEESLAEALRVAINEYNSETVFEVLN